MNIINILKNKKLPIVFLLITLVLSMFVLYTPKPVPKDKLGEFSAIRAQEHIEVISRKPHSYYDRAEHEEVRQYLIETLDDYLGTSNVYEYDYSVPEVKSEINRVNSNNLSNFNYNEDEVIHPIRNVLGVIPGENEEGIFVMAHYDSRGHVGRSGEQGRSYGAMDDGYGVSTMLELAYILKDENPKNSIYFLFTDAEEVGLYGALMASSETSLMNNAKFLINLESRGSHGPSYMFETSNNNHKVIELYKKASLPVTYSMATAVYSVMPNFTDFTAMTDINIPGLNFATLAGLDYYHTPLDRYENINISSIQHMGSQIEPIIREFISDDKYVTNNYFDANSNQVFFTLFAGVLISYSKIFSIVLVVTLLLLYIGIILIKVKEKTIKKELLTKTLPKGLLVFLGLVIVGVIYSMIVAFLGKTTFSITYTRVSNTEIPTLILIGLISLLLVKLFNKKSNDILFIGVSLNLLLAILTTFTLEGASFLFAFTTLFGLIALYVDKLNNKLIKDIVLGISYGFMLLMMIPILYSFYIALTVGGVAILLVLLIINGTVTFPIIINQFKGDEKNA